MEKRLEAVFHGHVQGVGFRFTVEALAQRFRVSGFVENTADGSVRLIAEGEENELSAFFLAIRNSQLSRHIKDFEAVWTQPEGEFHEFFIRYGGF